MAGQNTRRETTKLKVCTEWMELESDPGLFTLLLEDIGVTGVKVEEVYDVTQTFEDPVYGYVFLFQWVEERRARKKAMNEECYITEPSVLKNMFFAHQIVTNSCATHALLSIMLNHGEGGEMCIGDTLTQLKQICRNLNPESRGYAIGNTPELAVAHNQHAKPCVSLPTLTPSKRGSFVTSAPGLVPETYHFVSYVPIGERLFELDGLKQWPIDHGPWADTEDWTDLFKRVISKRLSEGDGIQFNLMALIPDPLPRISRELESLNSQHMHLLDHVFQLARERVAENDTGQVLLNGETDTQRITELIRKISTTVNTEAYTENNKSHILNSSDCSLEDAVSQVTTVNKQLEACKRKYQDEIETRKRFKYDAQRRTHNYDNFFQEYFKALAVHKLLPSHMLEVKRGGGKRGGRRGSGGRGRRTNGYQRGGRSNAVSNGTQ